MSEWIATKDLERWLRELRQQCDEAQFQESYRAGWRDALTSVMIKMDVDRKVHRS